VSRKKPDPGTSGWVQVVVGLAVTLTVAAGVGHNGVAAPRPPTVCAQLRVLLRGST
jgi:hypothetical protein